VDDGAGDGPSVGEFRFDSQLSRPRAWAQRNEFARGRDIGGARLRLCARRLLWRRRLSAAREGGAGTVARDAGGVAREKYAERVADPCPRVQGGIRTRGLETGHHRALSAAESLSDLPLVGRTGPQESRRRPTGAGGLLFDHGRIDEPELELLPRHQ